MGIKRNPEFKQMSFETAIRNPERYKEILKSVKIFEGVVLNQENLLIIVTHLYKCGIVKAKNHDFNSLSDKEAKNIVIEVNKTRNSDGGFPKGYPSRFWTYMRTLSELGFVYAVFNEKFELSPIANALINNEIDEQTAFANQATIYNRRSPYRNVSNDYNYFKFITKILIERWAEGKGITYEQFILSLFNKDGSSENYLNELNSFKAKDLESTYKYLKENYQITTKYGTVCTDYPDVVLRILRITGFITIKFVGKVIIQINEENIEKIKKLFGYDHKFNEEEKSNKRLYYEKYKIYASSQLLRTRQIEIGVSNRDYSIKLKKLISTYSLTKEIVTDLLDDIGNDKKIPIFKYIPEPIKLEFYISLILQISFGDKFNIIPNYKADSFGLPISQAPGNKADIEVVNDDIYWNIEVTLIKNKFQQLNNETSNIIRHLEEKNQETYLTFVAPIIHQDTQTFFENQLINFL
ncbi:AlwI family type II restriction endonuclease, partial [Malacoplasma penetrans]|uniref:AlwI family type II restriction endonuclease n=1 Tax=Malacoplasma penetrans TaxID=28227 RepID=UPI0010131898